MDRSQKLVHAEQQKKFLELSNKPSLALYMGFPEQLVPDDIKNQRLQPFLPPPRERSQSRPTQGGQKPILRTGSKRDLIRLKGPLSQEGEPTITKDQKDLGTFKPLKFFKELCIIEKKTCCMCSINSMCTLY